MLRFLYIFSVIFLFFATGRKCLFVYISPIAVDLIIQKKCARLNFLIIKKGNTIRTHIAFIEIKSQDSQDMKGSARCATVANKKLFQNFSLLL